MGEAYVAPMETAAPQSPGMRLPWEVRIEERVSPTVDCNPVRTQHTLVATVLDQMGEPMPGQRVEWILTRYGSAVGDIVSHDDQYGPGSIAPMVNARLGNNGNKITNHYAISFTNYGPELLDSGNNFPYMSSNGTRLPDFAVNRGESWLTITSTREGVTDIVVAVPGIRDGTKHKIFAKKIWADFNVEFPEDAVSELPSDTYEIPVRIHTTEGSGIPGHTVEAEILDGPEAQFESSGNATASLESDANGEVVFRVKNTGGTPGTNRIKLTAMGKFYGETCPQSVIMTNEWRSIALDVSCVMPPQVPVGQPFTKVITVVNNGNAVAEAVSVNEDLGSGLELVNGETFPMELGDMQPGQSLSREIRVVARAEGSFTNTVRVSSGSREAENSCSVEAVQGLLQIESVCEPAQAQVGQNTSFVVTVTNGGKAPLENVMVADEYPEGITPTSQNSANLGRLEPGESQEIIFSGVAEAAGTFTNIARATADGSDEASSQCTLEVLQCRLEIEIAPTKERIVVGDEAELSMIVKNVGDGEAKDCTVRVTYGQALGGGFEDFNIGPLATGEEWERTWSRRSTGAGEATVSADATCGAACKLGREAKVVVDGLTAIEVEMVDKGFDESREGVFSVGETFNYVCKISDDGGTQGARDLVAVLQLPSELEFVSGDGTGGVTVSGKGQTAESTAFDLPLKGSVTINFQVRVLSAPTSSMVKSVLLVNRNSDGATLADESESTTLRK